MIFIFALFVVAAWFALTIAIGYVATIRIENKVLRFVVVLALVGVLFPLPLVDELIGKRQFEELCKENSTIQVDRASAVGKTVYLSKTSDVEIKDKWVHIVLKPWRFVDVATGEPVVSYNTLMARGGWLIRMSRLSEGSVPLTFKGSCVPDNRPASIQTFKPLGINYIEPPAAPSGETK
jgi:hypothetical protein